MIRYSLRDTRTCAKRFYHGEGERPQQPKIQDHQQHQRHQTRQEEERRRTKQLRGRESALAEVGSTLLTGGEGDVVEACSPSQSPAPAGGNPRPPFVPRGPLSEAEKQRRRDHNLCLRCGQSGHYATNCPGGRGNNPTEVQVKTETLRASGNVKDSPA